MARVTPRAVEVLSAKREAVPVEVEAPPVEVEEPGVGTTEPRLAKISPPVSRNCGTSPVASKKLFVAMALFTSLSDVTAIFK